MKKYGTVKLNVALNIIPEMDSTGPMENTKQKDIS